jgi:hypothetical protein
VIFVAHPELAPANRMVEYNRPDDISDSGKSWRQILLEYNAEPKGNPRGLLPAYRLYENDLYRSLVDKYGIEQVYILSAGWGLIRSDFLTPYYDITFSANARGPDEYKRRKKSETYRDLNMLPADTDSEIVFFGGKDYVTLFCSLTNNVKGARRVFYNAAKPPEAVGCEKVRFERFETSTRTNWHYECAEEFIRLSPV